MHGLRRALAWALLTCSTAAAADVRIRADEWYPINAKPGSEQPGFMIELAQAMLAPHGHGVDYRLMAWDNALAAAQKGEIDCVVGALRSEAQGLLLPKRAWVLSEQTLYVRSDRSISYTDMADLPALKLAVIDGYSYGEALDEYISQNRSNVDRILTIPDSARAQKEMLMRLLVGHADALLETSVVMDATLRRDKLDGKVRRLAPALGRAAKQELFIACTAARVEGAQYVEIFDAEWQRLERSGELKALQERYGIQ